MGFAPLSPPYGAVQASSQRAVRREARLAFFAMRGEALPDVGARKSQKLQRERVIANGTRGAQPIVERVFGPADRIRCALRKPHRNIQRARLKLRIGHGHRDKADALVENFRPGTMERLGFAYEACAKLNPKIVYASITGFGEVGPARHEPLSAPRR